MKKFILLTAFINLIFLNACSNAPVEQANTVNVNAVNSNAEVAQEVNANLIPLKSLKNINVNASEVNSQAQTNANTKVNMQLNKANAPFDSTVMTTMNKDNQFLEVREFKKDPIILKIERLQELKKIKLYLKSGKVVEMPFDKGSVVFINGSPGDLLTAAGIKPPATPPNTNPGKVQEATKDAIKHNP
jgi:hypothetical protein